MGNQKLCQSCSYPLTNDEDFGTNADGSKNEDYCKHCYVNGALFNEKLLLRS